jgi:hypothetical protein
MDQDRVRRTFYFLVVSGTLTGLRFFRVSRTHGIAFDIPHIYRFYLSLSSNKAILSGKHGVKNFDQSTKHVHPEQQEERAEKHSLLSLLRPWWTSDGRILWVKRAC